MIIVDANILLYAYNADAPEHAASAAWLERALMGSETIGLPLPVIWAFLRIATNARLWPEPLPSREAFRIVKELLALPGVILVQAGARHLEILEELVTKCKATGPLMTDASLAALAEENGATLASTDRDFSRFDGLRWVDPMRLES
ncbi:MAG: PIN domain-containing protein [Candidatus Sulfopaludibacter sp.]|nr:PIN domain-containing protein [Candidatus Sulfopaludibacter sp.]